MAFSSSASFDYFKSGRPLATLAVGTGDFDYFKSNRPFRFASDTGLAARSGAAANSLAAATDAAAAGVAISGRLA